MAKTILVVDDEVEFLDLLHAVLTPEGYRVVTCSDASQALTQARLVRPDVVIVDLLMPNQSGWQVIEKIEADPVTAGSHIILCTGAAEAARSAEALKRGHDILLKPFNLSDLLELVGKCRQPKAS